MGSTLRHAFNLIGREQLARWVVLTVLAIMLSGFEVVGAALVYVLLGLVADPGGEIDLPLIGDVGSIFPAADQHELLLGVIATMAVFFVVRAAVRVVVKYLQQRVAHNAGARLSNELVEGYLRWPYEMHLHRTTSELIRNANEAVRQLVVQVFIPVIRVSAELVLVLGMLGLLVVIAPAATGLAVIVVGGAGLLLLLVVQPQLKRLGRRSHQLSQRTLSTLQQSLFGLRDIKILGRERFFARRYGRYRLEQARATYLSSTLKELPTVVIELSLIGFILLFFTIVLRSDGGAREALSVLGLFAYAGLRLQPSLQKIIAGFNELKFAAAPLEDLDADLRLVRSQSIQFDSTEPLPLRDALVIDNVTFRYKNATQDALQHVHLRIAPGEQIGICGPTGGGKSTLIDVIAGLLEPTMGRVYVDGIDLQGQVRAWQRNLGVVPQMVFLTDDTLRRNIALGIPDERIDLEAVARSIELAQLSDFVSSLPEGLDTTVGERGVRISGGQRQRLAIARALYRSPEVLIFDEGTSALDNATEAALMAAIERLRGDHTIILVAHRLSTVESCDRVVFVKDARIRSVGTYASLIEEDAAFRALAGIV